MRSLVCMYDLYITYILYNVFILLANDMCQLYLYVDMSTNEFDESWQLAVDRAKPKQGRV